MASRRSGPCGSGLPLGLLRFSPPHKSPTPDTAHRAATLRCSSTHATVVSAKPWSGVRRQRHCAALRSAGPGGLHVALRRRVGHTLVEHRAQRRCAAASRRREGEFVWPPSRPEHRKAVGPQGRPPYTSAGAYPAAALLAWSTHRIEDDRYTTTLARPPRRKRHALRTRVAQRWNLGGDRSRATRVAGLAHRRLRQPGRLSCSAEH